MNANDVLRAIERKHYDGAMARELVLNSEPDIAIANRERLDSAERMHGQGSRYYEYVKESMKGKPIADSVPVGWSPITSRRIDGLLYSKKKLIAIEVKVSVADYRRETPEKRAPWERVSNQFIYATPQGLLDPSTIPSHCGLWEINSGGGVEIVKKAKVNKTPEPMPQQVFIALMYRNAKK